MQVMSDKITATKYKQEGRALTGKHCAMRGTCTESLYLIFGQRNE